MRSQRNTRASDDQVLGLAAVARLAGVSTATVSRALSRPEAVSEDRRQRVAAAVAALNYMPNGAARALASRRTNIIGCVLPTLDHAIFAQTASTLQKHLAENDYTLLLSCHAFDRATEAQLARKLLERGVDGLVLVGIEHDAALMETIRARRLPCVLTWAFGGGDDPAIPRVGFDNRAAAEMVTEHLLALGHRAFAVVAGLRHQSERHDERVRGIIDLLARRGIAADQVQVLDGPIDYATGRRAVGETLEAGRMPTAFICSNDVIAVGAIAECTDRGLSVPRDVSITGFEDLDIAANVAPRLTTVRFPTRELGFLAATALLQTLVSETVVESIELSVTLVERGSTARPPR